MKRVFLLTYYLIIGCVLFAQKAIPVTTTPIKYYDPDGSDLIQIKNGLSIELTPLSDKNCYNFPELFSFTTDQIDGVFTKEWGINIDAMYPEYKEKRWCFTLGMDKNMLTAFKVKITNQTGHIIKMSQARILLRIDGEDPIKPITIFGDPTLVMTPNASGNMRPIPQSVLDNKDESLIKWVTFLENEYVKNQKRGFLKLEYPLGLYSQVLSVNKKAYKLIGNTEVEILPDDSYSGVLVFPNLIELPTSVKFYEFITKTDGAGNPTERTNFDFKFKVTADKMWYDRNEQIWKCGVPPSEKEYYNKNDKKWYYGEPNK